MREHVTLSTGRTLALGARLELGGVSETINVSAEAPLVESRTSDVTQLIESKSISDLSLGDRRTMNIINMTGAVVFVGYDNAGQKPNFSLAGGRTQSHGHFRRSDASTVYPMEFRCALCCTAVRARASI